jgi:hypothetical protein
VNLLALAHVAAAAVPAVFAAVLVAAAVPDAVVVR